MAELREFKRLNYFTSQFLQAEDFQDEQKYHRDKRHLLNCSIHEWGIVQGLDVSTVNNQQVSVSIGLAIDKDGQEIILPSAQSLAISGTPNTSIFITIQYQDVQDESDRYQIGDVDNYDRITERPLLQAVTAAPTDGSVIVLARVQLDNNGNIGSLDSSVRQLATAAIADGAVTTAKIADSAVNAAKIQNLTVGTNELANNAVTNAKIADNAVNAAKIQNLTVGTNELANNAVTNAKIANYSVSLTELRADLVRDIEISLRRGITTQHIENINGDAFYLISCRVISPTSIGTYRVNWYQRSEIHRSSIYSSSSRRQYVVFDNPGSATVTVQLKIYRLLTN